MHKRLVLMSFRKYSSWICLKFDMPTFFNFNLDFYLIKMAGKDWLWCVCGLLISGIWWLDERDETYLNWYLPIISHIWNCDILGINWENLYNHVSCEYKDHPENEVLLTSFDSSTRFKSGQSDFGVSDVAGLSKFVQLGFTQPVWMHMRLIMISFVNIGTT